MCEINSTMVSTIVNILPIHPHNKSWTTVAYKQVVYTMTVIVEYWQSILVNKVVCGSIYTDQNGQLSKVMVCSICR